jgi:hypothetical protein
MKAEGRNQDDGQDSQLAAMLLAGAGGIIKD